MSIVKLHEDSVAEVKEAQESAEYPPMSIARHIPSPKPSTVGLLDGEFRNWIQKWYHIWKSQATNFDSQDSCENLAQFKEDVVSQIQAMDLNDILMSVPDPRCHSKSLSHLGPPILVERDIDSTDVPDMDASQSDRKSQILFNRANDVQESQAKTCLQLPSPRHRKQPSTSSTGTGHYSHVSDRELESHELPPPLYFFACIPGKRPVGISLYGPLDTGHTAPAPLLRASILRSQGWWSHLEETCGELAAVNGTTIPKLGRIDLDVDFWDDDEKTYLKKRITWHVVPDDSIKSDCLFNWKLYFRFARIREHHYEKTCRISNSLRGPSQAGELVVPRL